MKVCRRETRCPMDQYGEILVKFKEHLRPQSCGMRRLVFLKTATTFRKNLLLPSSWENTWLTFQSLISALAIKAANSYVLAEL
jgi:hypothetical protein